MGEPLHVAEIAAATVAVAVTLIVVAYATGSFLLMSRHNARRALGASMRELVREIVFAGLTQPLLPLFYLLGRRMDPVLVRRGREGLARAAREGDIAPVPVVFVHGYMQNRADFIYLARALAKRGLGPLFGFNYPWFSSVEANAARLDRFVDRVCAETASPVVDLVGHSMGGVVALEMMRMEAEAEPSAGSAEGPRRVRVRRCVTIASPHAGVVWRGPVLGVGAASLRRGSTLLATHAGAKLKVPCLSVYSTHDNVVFPKETARLEARGGRDLEVDGIGHMSMLFSPVVAEHVAAFLSEPGGAEPVPEASR